MPKANLDFFNNFEYWQYQKASVNSTELKHNYTATCLNITWRCDAMNHMIYVQHQEM